MSGDDIKDMIDDLERELENANKEIEVLQEEVDNLTEKHDEDVSEAYDEGYADGLNNALEAIQRLQ